MKKLDIKTLLLSSALALGWQNAFAQKELPCSDNSHINDTIWVVKSMIQSKIEKRLIEIENFSKNEVVVISVNSPEEYWYSSFEEMGKDTIRKCRIWYKWQNTWVIVWYGKETKPHFHISTGDWVREYITPEEIQKLTRGSIENCDKFNTSCRIDEITQWLEKIISKHIRSQQNTNFDKLKKGDELANFFTYFYWWIIILLVLNNYLEPKRKRTFHKTKSKKDNNWGSDGWIIWCDAWDGWDGGW